MNQTQTTSPTKDCVDQASRAAASMYKTHGWSWWARLPLLGAVLLAGVLISPADADAGACTDDRQSPANTRVKLCKPIYDWEVDDVFKYFSDTGHRYTSWYESQLWADDTFRVATPLNTENSKKLDKWAKEDPEFYDRLSQIFPEIRAQERYIKDLDKSHIVKKYGKDLDGVELWIKNNIPSNTPAYTKALKELARLRRRAKTQPSIWLPNGNAEYILKEFMKGTYKRQIMPVKFKDRNKKRR